MYKPSRHTTSFQRLYDVYTTSATSYRRRIDVETTSCVHWETNFEFKLLLFSAVRSYYQTFTVEYLFYYYPAILIVDKIVCLKINLLSSLLSCFNLQVKARKISVPHTPQMT